ncbi:MAG: FAD-binding oxidoreductase [Candidatus Binatus sp.]|uniref:FAD-binding protein n=1 Tax=Candidatus Binatus sp. TaxID=2811406 RepID=UPI00271E7F9A|nr:FAD-binding oxidoreductase [Candidatus Binatus sp.]MDO8432346.1 FAD-binding oxidoreductase [Candidatus Binatus sp.]
MAAVTSRIATAAALKPRHAMLSGWGRFPLSESDIYRPEKIAELQTLVTGNGLSLIARGAGRAYGDAAQNDQNRVADIQRLNRMLSFEPESALLRCEAGVTIAEIIDVFLPRGYFPPVTPGTRFVTLGGSIAADVHGKNHHRDSSLASHVTNFDLMLATGEILRCSREEHSDLFWATVGGMGLTGVIVEVELRLRPVESAYFNGELIRARNIDAAIEAFERTDSEYGYSVAWIDCAIGKNSLGRSVLNVGNFATLDTLPDNLAQDPFSVTPPIIPSVPFDLPGWTLNALTVKAFNAVYYMFHRDTRARTIFDWQSFFYPLDSIRSWNRIYGKRGFVQYQCVWPLAESRAGLIELLEAISRSRRASFLAVLKKFGAQEGMLSFPMPGYTLALDFPVNDTLLEFLDTLDAMVLKRGGRVYLAKDARMRPETFRAMYPNFPRWQQAKALADPDNRFSSSLSRRLAMDPA